jgi:geranylgeranyl pyrophosphate synthase
MSLLERYTSVSGDYLPDASKIAHPTIQSMAEEYALSGVPDHAAEVLSLLPHQLQEPIKYAFANHVTKERPLTLLHVAEEVQARREKALGVATCVDVLWNVARIVDDIFDKDETNSNQSPSAWARYGRSVAMAASTAAVASTVAYAARNYGSRQAYAMSRQLERGVASLRQSRSLSLEGPLEPYYVNYDMRSAFYTVQPIATIGKYSEASPEQLFMVQRSLQRMNRAGQMINDLADFDESDDRSRTVAFSDIRNGVSSVPIRHMWQAAGSKDRQRFAGIHGKTELGVADASFIRRLILETELAPSVVSLIETEYATARDEYADALEPSAETLDWLDAWLSYKRGQARGVVTAIGG